MRISDIKILVNSLLTLWVPFSGHLYLKIILSLLGTAQLVSLIALALKNKVQREKSVNANSVAQIFAAIFVATYLLFLFAYNSLADPAVDLGIRVLLPVYVFGIILSSI